jgi:hypothetical protein
MSSESKTIREYLRERWDTTEPGLQWAYILSIIGTILSILSYPSYLPGINIWLNSIIVPAAFLSWVKRNFQLRIIWLGFTALFILSGISIIYGIFSIFNTLHLETLFYISLVLVILAFVMGFKSINLKKESYQFLEKAQMRLFAVIYMLLVLSYLTDLPLNRYLPRTEYIHWYIVTFCYSIPFVMIPLYVLVIISIARRYSFGIVLTPILSIAIAVPWFINDVFRLNAKFLKPFCSELTICLAPLFKGLVVVKAIVVFILPILLIVAVIYFFKSIWDTARPEIRVLKDN